MRLSSVSSSSKIKISSPASSKSKSVTLIDKMDLLHLPDADKSNILMAAMARKIKIKAELVICAKYSLITPPLALILYSYNHSRCAYWRRALINQIRIKEGR